MQKISNPKLDFDANDIKNMISTMTYFFDRTSEVFNQYGNKYAAGSIASEEIATFPNPKLISDVYSCGLLSMESAADHLISVSQLLIEPIKSLSPWTCARGLLESAALSCWFLDPNVTAKERVGRCYSFRYEGFEQQKKFHNKNGDQQGIEQVNNRISEVESEALSLDFPKLSKNNAITGIGQHWPGITNLIETTLQRESDYRMLSAVTHGHHWATHQVGFGIIEIETEDGQTIKALKKGISPPLAIYLGLNTVMPFAKVLWLLWQLFGWDRNELKALLEEIYDRMAYGDLVRFWRIPLEN